MKHIIVFGISLFSIQFILGQCEDSFNARLDEFVINSVFNDIVLDSDSSFLTKDANKSMLSLTSEYQLAYDYKEAEKIEKDQYQALEQAFSIAKKSILNKRKNLKYIGCSIYDEKILTDGSSEKIYRYRTHMLVKISDGDSYEIWEIEIVFINDQFHLVRLREEPFTVIEDKEIISAIENIPNKLSETFGYARSNDIDTGLIDRNRLIDTKGIYPKYYSLIQICGDESTTIEGLLTVYNLKVVLKKNIQLNPKSAEELLAIYNLIFSLNSNATVTINTSSIKALSKKKEIKVSYQPKDEYFFQQSQGTVSKDFTYCILVDDKLNKIKFTLALNANEDRTFDLSWTIKK